MIISKYLLLVVSKSTASTVVNVTPFGLQKSKQIMNVI
jgi:hypothetical protein